MSAVPPVAEPDWRPCDRLWFEGEQLGDAVPSILKIATRDDAVMVVQSFSKATA